MGWERNRSNAESWNILMDVMVIFRSPQFLDRSTYHTQLLIEWHK